MNLNFVHCDTEHDTKGLFLKCEISSWTPNLFTFSKGFRKKFLRDILKILFDKLFGVIKVYFNIHSKTQQP